MDRSPVHHRATQRQTHTHTLTLTARDNLQTPINLTCMFLDSGRKPEYPERTHAYTGRTCKLPTYKSIRRRHIIIDMNAEMLVKN